MNKDKPSPYAANPPMNAPPPYPGPGEPPPPYAPPGAAAYSGQSHAAPYYPQTAPMYSTAPPQGINPYHQNATAGYPQAVPSGYLQASAPPPLPPGHHVVYNMPAAYDAGARFDGISRPVVPPPPPGVAPNAAQIAAMQGNSTVVLGKQKSSFFSGGSDGGWSFW